MTYQLRPFQQALVDDVRMQWLAGASVVAMVLSTGGGKTVCLSDIILSHAGFSCVIAHRAELVSQLSLTLAKLGVRHDIIGSDKTRKSIARAHVEELGACYYQPGARCTVASIDTLIRAKGLDTWARQVTLWITDEGHHLVRDNKWCRGVSLFTHPDCKGLLPTATPKRADGKGLGSHADGYADVMVEGPPMRWLIDEGYLCDYRVIAPPSDLIVTDEPGASGDYSPTQLRKAAQRSHITGDIPAHYVKHAAGRLGITFCTDVETAAEMTESYRKLGVVAELLTGETDDYIRRDILRRYRAGEVRQLCVVDIVSEGFDLPDLQVGSFGRPTKSLAVWMQQFGRLLRAMYAPGYDLSTREGRLAAIAAGPKPYALAIDHVGMILDPTLGPPDRPRVWSLDRRDKRAAAQPQDAIPLRRCLRPESPDWPVGCYKPHPRYHTHCPFCGYEPEPAGRSAPAQVDGDLQMLDPAVLDRLRGAVISLDESPDEYARGLAAQGVPQVGISRNTREFYPRRQEAQRTLRDAMDRWGGTRHAEGLSDREIQRAFWLTYGVDVLSAQALGPTEAFDLAARIDGAIGIDGTVNNA